MQQASLNLFDRPLIVPPAESTGMSRSNWGEGRERKSELGQFMTPAVIADFMSGLFTSSKLLEPIEFLEPSAGRGSLIDSFLKRQGITKNLHITSYEVDPALYLSQKQLISLRVEQADLKYGDFLEHIRGGLTRRYTHVLMNPPYKKLRADSHHNQLLLRNGIQVPNLYAAFLAVALLELKVKGELIALIPRSFCNGAYFKEFRRLILSESSLEHLHIFTSRTDVFKADRVLQETVILKLVRGVPQRENITFSRSSDGTFSDLDSKQVAFSEIVLDDDREQYLRDPSDIKTISNPHIRYSLKELGVSVSTGPIVGFRSKEYLQDMPSSEAPIPLLHPYQMHNGLLKWPLEHPKKNKANALLSSVQDSKLYPPGYYCVVKRVTSKEEPRRLVSAVFDPIVLDVKEKIGFENRLNVFHMDKSGTNRDLAYGLSTFLNSTFADRAFRSFSGHTQVNATDLRQFKFPSLKILNEIGSITQRRRPTTQDGIDVICKEFF